MAGKDLIPPEAVIEVARCTMGGIDCDLFSTLEGNRVVQAAWYRDRQEQTSDRFQVPTLPEGSRKRMLLAVPGSAALARDLSNHLLQGYRRGLVSEAIIWSGNSEVLALCPWMWDFPICLPFRRLAAQFWDDELEKCFRVSPSGWSPIIYLPRSGGTSQFQNSLARFHAAASTYGRVVLDEWSGEGRWHDCYQALVGRPYVNHGQDTSSSLES